MLQDQSSIEAAPPRPRGPGPLVFAGVVGACALGIGLGLWARPTDLTEMTPRKPPAAAQPQASGLQIVIDETPAPVGQPLEVLPPSLASPAPVPTVAEPTAPHRPASGLVKVDAPVAAPPVILPAVDAMPPRRPSAATQAPAEPDPAAAAKAERARVEARARNREALRAEALRVEKARARRAEARAAEARAELAAAQEAKAAKARAARLAQAEKAKAARLARADTRRRTPAAKPTPRLAAVARPVKAAAARAKAEAVRLAARRRQPALADGRPTRAKVQTARAPARAQAARTQTARATAPRRPAIPRGEGPRRVARADPCAGYDPGAAAVCADPRLGARERQLQQAYRNAEAAGVPASALRRQQARWQQARAAAAREAPWAVEDVYVARISELNDQTRDAREN